MNKGICEMQSKQKILYFTPVGCVEYLIGSFVKVKSIPVIVWWSELTLPGVSYYYFPITGYTFCCNIKHKPSYSYEKKHRHRSDKYADDRGHRDFDDLLEREKYRIKKEKRREGR